MSQVLQPMQLNSYLNVGEAAEFLGVSPWTLRNWDKAGKLKPIRHPKNGYRIYHRDALIAVLEMPQTLATQMQRMTPRIDWRAMGEAEHFVQFYESEQFLIDAVCGFLGTVIMTGEVAIMVVTPEHRLAIQAELFSRGLDLNCARVRGKLLVENAHELLGRFMVNGEPDRDRFFDSVGKMIAQATRGPRKVRAFGEMVAILVAEGNHGGAIKLERLWNELAQQYSFALFCAYPLKGCGVAGDEESFAEICDCHTQVIPAESYAGLLNADERLRAISRLQQRVVMLETRLEKSRRGLPAHA